MAALADLLREPLEDPLTPECIAVHSRGIERWIAQELSTRLGTGRLGADGIAANIDFPFPGRLVRRAVATASGTDGDDPWLPERSTWPLLAILDDDPGHERLGPLRSHADGPSQSDGLTRRLGAVRHVADLFDRYGVHRPEMVRAWRDGQDVNSDGEPLGPHHRWQAALWRELADRIGDPSFAERHGAAIEAIRADRDTLELPRRISLFGLTALPATYLQVLDAIAAHRDVHLLLLHPSAALWDQVSTTVASQPRATNPWARDEDPTAALAANNLLRSWGRDARELQLVAPTAGTVSHHPVDERGRSLLHRIQADIRADRVPGGEDGDNRLELQPGDRSVQIHACHGRLRQVEVLRDAILHLLAEDATLELRDVIVMCPDIEGFASLITAVFGAEAATAADSSRSDSAPPALRVRLADRSLRRTNPVLDVVSTVLDLADGRVTASALLELLSRPPVRRRFALDDDDLEQLESWIDELHIRWGFDAEHRRDHGLPALAANTWEAGLRRLQLGMTMADEDGRILAGTVPFDGVEGRASGLAGRLAEFVARLRTATDQLRGPHSMGGWRDAITAASDALTLTDGENAWQRIHLDRVLDELVDEATAGGVEGGAAIELTLPEVETLLADRLAGRASTTGHRTGSLTFSTLVPMRSVPHRVVCLLGLDDGAFPRQTVPDSDDLLLRSPRVGDRDPRSEDRQLLLDAVLAATDTLVVTYAGRDVRTNEPRPPAVPVDELLDVVDRTATTADGTPPREQIVTPHPLTEHDPRNFEPGAIHPAGRPWGFHPGTLAAAEAHRRDPQPPRPFLTQPLTAPTDDVIDLDDLIAFLEHPVRYFCRQQLDVRFTGDQDPISDRIPSALDGLEKWKIGEALLDAWRRGRDLEQTERLLAARGQLPPGDVGTDDLEDVKTWVDRITTLCTHRDVEPREQWGTIDVHVELPDGHVLDGIVTDLADWRLETISYSRVKPKTRIATWVRFLALSLAKPDAPWQALTAGRHPWKRGRAATYELPTLPGSPAAVADAARGHLQRLVELFQRGRCEPVPIYAATSNKIAENLHADNPADHYVHKEWETGTRPGAFPREDLDPYHVAVLGGQVPCSELFRDLCRDDEESSWADDERRIVAYAWRLWEPILRHERRCDG